MENPFELINERLDKIEALSREVMRRLDANQGLQEIELGIENPTRLVSAEKAVEITGFTKAYIYELTSKKKIPFYKKGKSVRFDIDELDAWMRSGRPDVLDKAIKSLRQ